MRFFKLLKKRNMMGLEWSSFKDILTILEGLSMLNVISLHQLLYGSHHVRSIIWCFLVLFED